MFTVTICVNSNRYFLYTCTPVSIAIDTTQICLLSITVLITLDPYYTYACTVIICVDRRQASSRQQDCGDHFHQNISTPLCCDGLSWGPRYHLLHFKCDLQHYISKHKVRSMFPMFILEWLCSINLSRHE